MKIVIKLVLLIGAVTSCLLAPRTSFAQECKDEEAMVVDYEKGLYDLVAATRKESLSDFERAYHQKTALTKLTLTLSMVNELLDCLDKAAGNAAAPKDQLDAYSAKRAVYSKLKNKLEESQKLLKGAADSKAAKGIMEKLDYSAG